MYASPPFPGRGATGGATTATRSGTQVPLSRPGGNRWHSLNNFNNYNNYSNCSNCNYIDNINGGNNFNNYNNFLPTTATPSPPLWPHDYFYILSQGGGE